uniref:Ovule protein n=1 Tax=Steinernema glaseri TaxID=37863 RepID=A0A1I7YTG5_9BILA
MHIETRRNPMSAQTPFFTWLVNRRVCFQSYSSASYGVVDSSSSIGSGQIVKLIRLEVTRTYRTRRSYHRSFSLLILL